MKAIPNKNELKAYRQRWVAANGTELKEMRSASPLEKFSQLAALMASIFSFLANPHYAFAQTSKSPSAQIVRNISAEGSCAIVGRTAEQCQLLALHRARAAAIEEAAGI